MSGPCWKCGAQNAPRSNRTEDELQQISLIKAMEKDFETGSIHYELDTKFHKEIAGATHNTILTHLVGSFLI